MSRYHHLIDAHMQDYALVTDQIQRILAALDANDLDKARAEVMNTYENARQMRTMFEEMSLLVKVLMLEFQSDDAVRRSSPTPKRQKPTSGQTTGQIQLELFALLTEIQAKQQLSKGSS